MIAPMPQHTENIKTGPCARCGDEEELVGHYGSLQQIKVCRGCDAVLWVERVVAPGSRHAGGLVLRGTG